jgi:hypothetical protein
LTALVTWIGEPTAGVTVRTMLIGRVTFTGIPQLVSAGFDRGLVVPRTCPLLEPNLHSKLLMTVDGGVTEAVNVQRRTLPLPTCFTLQSAVLGSLAVTVKFAVGDAVVVVLDDVVVVDVVDAAAVVVVVVVTGAVVVVVVTAVVVVVLDVGDVLLSQPDSIAHTQTTAHTRPRSRATATKPLL